MTRRALFSDTVSGEIFSNSFALDEDDLQSMGAILRNRAMIARGCPVMAEAFEIGADLSS